MTAFLRRAAIIGLVTGLVITHLSLVGLILALNARYLIADIISIGSTVLVVAAFAAGFVAAGSLRRGAGIVPPPTTALASGAVAGAAGGLVIALLAFIIDTFDPSSVLISARPQLVAVLHWGQEVMVGNLINVGGGALIGVLGAGLRLVPPAPRRGITAGLIGLMGVALMQTFVNQIFRGLSLDAVNDFLYERDGMTPVGAITVALIIGLIFWAWATKGSDARRRYAALAPREQQGVRIGALSVTLIILATLPLFIGPFLSQTMDAVGIYILLGLGLNIVVGFAGLLDLGYVAFYAVGAYSTAVLTSPASPLFTPELDFWVALPFVMIITAMVGILIGAPVLRLRGDYLAIVTLGFGEIARIIFLSDAASPFLGGAQGILQIPPPEFLGEGLRQPERLYYPILISCIIAAVVAISLANSRVGRAWTAMREDESVAEATGVNTTKYKLLAFALGATFGGLAGALYAVRIGSVFPLDLNILVSINALALIILGGIGSIPGVIVGAIVLVGLPELLREFAEFRLLLYGIVLVAMMILRPEGLVPNRSRRAELHESEDQGTRWDEEQWEEEAGVETPEPRITT